MKKLMIIAAVAFVAIVSQGSTVNWASGAVTIAGSDGNGWGSSVLPKNSSDYTLEMYVYTTYSDGKLSGLIGSGEKDGTSAKGKLDGNLTTTPDLSSGTSYYAQAIITDSTGNTLTSQIMNFVWDGSMVNPKIDFMSETKTGLSSLSSINGSYSSTTGWWQSTGWVAAPEPTSGLLLLIGMASLALRRRRA